MLMRQTNQMHTYLVKKFPKDLHLLILYPTATLTTSQGRESYSGSVLKAWAAKPLKIQLILMSSERRMRGDDLENPTRGQLLALSDAFDIDPSYWFGRGSRRPVLNPDLAEALKDDRNYALLHKSLGLRDSDKDIVMVLMEQLRGREEPDKR